MMVGDLLSDFLCISVGQSSPTNEFMKSILEAGAAAKGAEYLGFAYKIVLLCTEEGACLSVYRLPINPKDRAGVLRLG